MCTIAAYNGDKAAFPILVEMMEAMQGFNSGFFTGIATIDDGKLYYQKVVGDLSRLLKIVNAENMPGKIGIIHSRTNADGTVNRAHPFVGFKDGQPYLILCKA